MENADFYTLEDPRVTIYSHSQSSAYYIVFLIYIFGDVKSKQNLLQTTQLLPWKHTNINNNISNIESSFDILEYTNTLLGIT